MYQVPYYVGVIISEDQGEELGVHYVASHSAAPVAAVVEDVAIPFVIDD